MFVEVRKEVRVSSYEQLDQITSVRFLNMYGVGKALNNQVFEYWLLFLLLHTSFTQKAGPGTVNNVP